MKAKKIHFDNKLVKNLCKFIEDDIVFFRKCRVDEISCRRILIGYYDILSSVIFTISITKGNKIIGRTELFVFLRKIEEGKICEKFEGFSKLRDNLIYAGESVSEIEVRFLIGEVNNSIRELRNKYLREYA